LLVSLPDASAGCSLTTPLHGQTVVQPTREQRLTICSIASHHLFDLCDVRMRPRLLACRRCRAVLRPRRQVSDVTNLEIVRQNTARITYADGTTEQRDTRTLRQDDAATSAWMLARAALDATASEFACAALDESPFLSRAALLDRKLHGTVPNPVDTPATRFGQASEPLAVQAYRDKTGFEVRATGLYTCDELRYGASPDGVVVDRASGEEGLLEVKCLYRERRRSYVSAAKPPARFLAQVQGQLALSGHAWCDLAIWIPNHLAIFRVARDAYYWDAVLKPGLVAFSDELRRRRVAA
jgi:hypothetical protein